MSFDRNSEVGSFFGTLAKVATAAVSPVLAADKLLRKVPGYKQVSKLAPAYAQREKALNAAHSLVKRAEKGDVSAKQAIGLAVSAAAKGDPRAKAAVHALSIARQVSKGAISADCLRAGSKVATAGELAIVRGLPHMDRTELVTAGGCGLQTPTGYWLATAGGDVFVPAAYEGTAGARAARGQTLVMQPRIRRQLQAAAKKERAGQLPLGTTRRWAERAVSGFESAHGGAQTLREWLGQEPSLNVALK